jgi:hypothetical protein
MYSSIQSCFTTVYAYLVRRGLQVLRVRLVLLDLQGRLGRLAHHVVGVRLACAGRLHVDLQLDLQVLLKEDDFLIRRLSFCKK